MFSFKFDREKNHCIKMSNTLEMFVAFNIVTYLIENSLMCMMLFPVTIAQTIHMQGIKVCVIMVHLLPSKELIVQDVSLTKIILSVCLYAHVCVS